MNAPTQFRLKKTESKVEVVTPGSGDYLAYIRLVVADLARQIGFHEDEVAKIEMAVDEACSNVVEHAYSTKRAWHWDHSPEIRLDIRDENDRLIIEINDHGQQFDFSNYKSQNIEERIAGMKTGGYGIFIMRKFMDEVQYSSSAETGNTLRLVKYLKKS